MVVDLQLKTAAGMVRVASVACLVMGGGEMEFLLGDETLKSLGIDVHRQLEQLAGGDVVTDDDPFEPMTLPADTDVVARLDTMLAAVLHGGFEPTLYEELRRLVFEYQDIFAIDVGDDPPANVEPLIVTLKPDASRSVPSRASMRLLNVNSYAKSYSASRTLGIFARTTTADGHARRFQWPSRGARWSSV